MVRVGKLDYENLLHQKGSSKMDFTGKIMRGFLFIDAAGFDIEEDLDFWISKALEFNRFINPSIWRVNPNGMYPLCGPIHEVDKSLWDKLLVKFTRLFFNNLHLLLPKNAVFIRFRQ